MASGWLSTRLYGRARCGMFRLVQRKPVAGFLGTPSVARNRLYGATQPSRALHEAFPSALGASAGQGWLGEEQAHFEASLLNRGSQRGSQASPPLAASSLPTCLKGRELACTVYNLAIPESAAPGLPVSLRPQRIRFVIDKSMPASHNTLTQVAAIVIDAPADRAVTVRSSALVWDRRQGYNPGDPSKDRSGGRTSRRVPLDLVCPESVSNPGALASQATASVPC